MTRSFLNALVIGALVAPLPLLAQQSGQSDEWSEWEEWEEPAAASNFSLNGFVELAGGLRLATDPALDDNTTLADARVQLRGDYKLSSSVVTFRGDLYYDGVVDNVEADLRELHWQSNLGFMGDWGNHLDLKIGQQVLTWGTGDYLFLNDLFAKDYQSFFAGRDDEYLKAPSLSAKLSAFTQWGNLDLVLTPRFTPDNAITGEYFSFFSPQAGQNIAPGFVVADENRPTSPEWALRWYKTAGSTELAAYGYRGYQKTPVAADEQGRPRYSRLNVYGVSAVRPLGKGLANAEYAYYDSSEDSNGNNPMVPNSQHRWLLGYEQEIVANLTGSAQWYLEQIRHHSALLAHSPWPEYEQSQRRQVVTVRLTYLMLRQTLTLSGFNFYSPGDEDGYLKFRVSYSPGDDWQLNAGFNLFYGQQAHTFYAQFEDASNLYASFRYYY
ncbi:hypothetical protein [Alteromonas aestuariivivens]|nr:hypothetical protein [Alteromonas aestuariivivens]